MRTYFWMLGFLGMFLFSLISLDFNQKFTGGILTAQKKNVDLVIVPICLDRSNIPDEELHWLYMPNDPQELATNEYYGYLSGQLITAGVVDASDCPLNGLWSNGYANACGLDKTREKSLYLQNVYDDEILAAGKGLGVPPLMVKQLIRYESQFWPTQMGPYHFGLGHLTYLGASNAITWSRALAGDMYAQLSPQPVITNNMMASQLIAAMDASCTTCPLKINIPKAEQSILYIAETLLAYCRQTSQIVYNATRKNPGDVVDYATIWKLTLLNYNMGPLCVYDGINRSYQSGEANSTGNLSWDAIAANLKSASCDRGIPYVENITGVYYDFGASP